MRNEGTDKDSAMSRRALLLVDTAPARQDSRPSYSSHLNIYLTVIC